MKKLVDIGIRRIEVVIRTKALDVISGQELGMDTPSKSVGVQWSRTLTTRRGGSERSSLIEQSQRHGHMSEESPDESGQVQKTCNSSYNAAVIFKNNCGYRVLMFRSGPSLAASRVRRA